MVTGKIGTVLINLNYLEILTVTFHQDLVWVWFGKISFFHEFILLFFLYFLNASIIYERDKDEFINIGYRCDDTIELGHTQMFLGLGYNKDFHRSRKYDDSKFHIFV